METNHLNQHQLAKRWSMSYRTLERWRWLGVGPKYLKIGGKVVYRLEDIEAYEAESLRTGTPKANVILPETRAREIYRRSGQ
jgi:predicted site-specific integrase-resolvase